MTRSPILTLMLVVSIAGCPGWCGSMMSCCPGHASLVSAISSASGVSTCSAGDNHHPCSCHHDDHDDGSTQRPASDSNDQDQPHHHDDETHPCQGVCGGAVVEDSHHLALDLSLQTFLAVGPDFSALVFVPSPSRISPQAFSANPRQRLTLRMTFLL